MADHPQGTVLRAFPTEPLPGLWAWVCGPQDAAVAGIFVSRSDGIALAGTDVNGDGWDAPASCWQPGDHLIRLDGLPVQPQEPRPPQAEWFNRWPSWLVEIGRVHLVLREYFLTEYEGVSLVSESGMLLPVSSITRCLPVTREGFPLPVGWEVVGG
jgi:hypothetical protein